MPTERSGRSAGHSDRVSGSVRDAVGNRSPMTDHSQADPQDVAEQLDEDVTNTDPGNPDPGNPEQNGLTSFAPDEPLAVDDEQVTEPIVDSVASRDERLQPEVLDDVVGPSDDLASALTSAREDDLDDELFDLAADPNELAPEEAALHLVDDSELG